MTQPPERKDGGPKKRKHEADIHDHVKTPKKAREHPNKRQKTGQNQQHFRHKQRDARVLATQTSSSAFKNGALDVSAFVSAREFEIRALEQGLQRSKKALNRRAFQQVPRELRRRTAAHDVRRIPKRLRERGRREMREDNTPGPGGVGKRVKKVSTRARLRDETVKKLRALGTKKKAEREEKKGEEKVKLLNPNDNSTFANEAKPAATAAKIQTRKPKVKKIVSLASAPTPKAKFRKRQINKSWLPTHLFHAKRAHMSPPSDPQWRFAIPLTPTQKSYRPTHRASRDKGAVAWDMSYMATIALDGRESSLKNVLRGLGVGVVGKAGDKWVWAAKGSKWRSGRRTLETVVFERESGQMIAPIAILWCGLEGELETTETARRKMFVRVHPSAFHRLWAEMVRLAKVSKPEVKVEDLRFEIGSIEITGPGATEALLAALWPYDISDQAGGKDNNQKRDIAAKTWTKLNGLADTSSLPAAATLGFSIQDPRIHHPPRTVSLPKTQDDYNELLAILASWPPDTGTPSPSTLFDSISRTRASKLPSQKAINRRRSLAAPGAYPNLLNTDPAIPVVLYRSTSCSSSGWTMLAPWKAIQPIWYSLVYYPLSTGGQPRFGGLREQRQVAFETGRPWYPGDAPGTEAGWNSEMSERKKRLEEWKRRPKGKRIAWEKVEANRDGKDGRGEVGEGWACGWEMLLETDKSTTPAPDAEHRRGTEAPVHEAIGVDASRDNTETASEEATKKDLVEAHSDEATTAPTPSPSQPFSKPKALTQLSRSQAEDLLRSYSPTTMQPSPSFDAVGKLVTVKLTLLTRGVPQSCARVYRLPGPTSCNAALRDAWLRLLPGKQLKKKNKLARPPRFQDGASEEAVQRRLAEELIWGDDAARGEDAYPACPSQEDLIGFVTAGNYNLAEGKGTGIGSIAMWRLGDMADFGKKARLCIVRNAGEGMGRLARWEVV